MAKNTLKDMKSFDGKSKNSRAWKKFKKSEKKWKTKQERQDQD